MSAPGIVILNYRTAALAIDCLQSLAEDRGSWTGRAIVVDNDSQDGSAQRIAEAIASRGFSSWAELVSSPRNGGYAAGNNLGVRRLLQSAAPPASILLLNPDTRVRPGAVAALCDFLAAHPAAGLVGSRLEDPDGSAQQSAFRFHGVLSELERGLRLGLATRLLSRFLVAPPLSPRACRADWVAGAALLVRREVFERVGLLDEGFFLYFEEVDFCLRAARAGFQCWYEPKSRVVHLRGQATGLTDPRAPPTRMPAYWFASRRRYFVKNLGVLRAACADLAWAFGHLVFRLRAPLQGKPLDGPGLVFTDFFAHSVFVRGFSP